MKAFILAAGFGRRMGILTHDLPKPLLPVGGYPLLCYTLFRLHRWGIREAVVNVHYHGDLIEGYLQRFPHFPVHVSWERDQILGSAGGIRNALDWLGSEPFLLANPDQILRLDAGPDTDLLRTTKAESAGGQAVGRALLYVLPKASRSRETGFSFVTEDPHKRNGPQEIRCDPTGAFFYMGCAILGPELFAPLKPNEFSELLPLIKHASASRTLFGQTFPGTLCDAGTAAAYAAVKDVHGGGLLQKELELFKQFTASWPAAFGPDP